MSDDLKASDANTLNEVSAGDNSNEKSIEEQVKIITSEINDLIYNVMNSAKISQAVDHSQVITQNKVTSKGQGSKAADIGADVNSTALTLAGLNSIKAELSRLPLDFSEREYISSYITPLMTALELLARTGFDLSTSVSVLTSSPIVPRKKGKLKDTIHTIYSINEEVEEIYKVLKNRFKAITRDDNCRKLP